MRDHLRTLLAVAGVVALAGCSDGATEAAPTPGQEALGGVVQWDEQAIVEHLGAQPIGDGAYTVDGCEISVVLKTPQEVALYADAGDPVATTPDGSGGVKTTAECVDGLTEALADLSP